MSTALPWTRAGISHAATGGPSTPTIKHPSENQPQEVLAGLVERVTYQNVESGFCVLRAKARGHRDVVTVVGHAATIAAGEWSLRAVSVIYRNYFAPIGGSYSQTAERQFDGLADLGEALSETPINSKEG